MTAAVRRVQVRPKLLQSTADPPVIRPHQHVAAEARGPRSQGSAKSGSLLGIRSGQNTSRRERAKETRGSYRQGIAQQSRLGEFDSAPRTSQFTRLHPNRDTAAQPSEGSGRCILLASLPSRGWVEQALPDSKQATEQAEEQQPETLARPRRSRRSESTAHRLQIEVADLKEIDTKHFSQEDG